MTEADFRAVLAEATLAPSVHNTQPWRWRREGAAVLVGADLTRALPASDPEGRDAALSCGAAVEGFVLALSARGRGALVEDLWPADDRRHLPGCRLAARILPQGEVAADPLAALLPRRFTHRGAFAPGPAPDWVPADAVLVTDAATRDWIARLNDETSLAVLRNGPLRRELLAWMRLSPRHPRHGLDGMSREALRLPPLLALGARLGLGPLFPVLDRLGLAAGLTAEAAATRSAPVIATFHRPEGESPVTSGRAYLRFWLEATARGLAGWPMAALTDDPAARALLASRLAIPAGRRPIQALRLGPPPRPMPPRARRPLAEVLAE